MDDTTEDNTYRMKFTYEICVEIPLALARKSNPEAEAMKRLKKTMGDTLAADLPFAIKPMGIVPGSGID